MKLSWELLFVRITVLASLMILGKLMLTHPVSRPMNSPAHPQIQRTLAAIVITDAVGFSKRMSQDEDRALAIINRDLQLIGELCEFFEGQILKTVGDGMLMYFVSAVQAAACAIEMQKTFASFAKTGKQDEHFTHRVGVHLGDIFFNQQDMMGTGVNIAARLESEAKPGAVCMSQVVYDVVKSRLELDACYIGKLALKNIEEAVAAYHVWPLGMKPEENNGESTEAIAPLKMTPLSTALKALSEHANGRRIKKLLYGTHKAAWENSAAVLEAVPMRMLLESLTDRNPTLHDCRQSLFQIVRTLNRQDEYAQVAEVILESLAIFYAG
ncbi:MAG: adenylate/guanylate cyclase domain-containing protein, partial [Cyanobacteria bacterium J06553_1]